jgi:uroporphyrinogen decarboxylase
MPRTANISTRLKNSGISYKNDLILKSLSGETVSRPPVWMMRQAGRYLPDFMKLSEKYSFFERVETPELASQITVMPIEQIGTDAAIIFSDILVIPQALGFEVKMVKGEGPVLPNPIKTTEDVKRISLPDINEKLHYVFDAIKLSVKELDSSVPLIGFAGAPWTIFCYMVEGHGSKNFEMAKAFCFSQPEATHLLLQKITDTTIHYLNAQTTAGAAIIQLFDSWGGILSPDDYREFSLPYIQQIIEHTDSAYKIVFAKGCWFALPELNELKNTALGVDWAISPQQARLLTGNNTVLQGNFDPSRLFSSVKEIERLTHEMIRAFGKDKYIANLGHGILPNVPVEHAKAFVDAVKSFKK